MNRGQRIANSILARHYPDTLIKRGAFSLSDGADHTIPADCWEDMVKYIEISVPNAPTETRQRSYRDATKFSSASPVAVPWDWVIEGRLVRFLQPPTSSYTATPFYVRRLEHLVLQQGRIAEVGATYLSVDTTGVDADESELTANSDSLNSYVNVINWKTGEIRGTLQVSSFTDSRITLRSSPIRTEVLGRTVTSSDDMADLGIEEDDYVCLVHGTCIPYFQDQLADYLVEYAVTSLARSGSGADARLEKQFLDDMEKRLEGAWTGRQGTNRITNRSGQWPNRSRRWPSS